MKKEKNKHMEQGKEQKERKKFVDDMALVLKQANKNISDVTLSKNQFNEELVIVTMDNGSTYKILTELDSLMSLLYDVTKFIRSK